MPLMPRFLFASASICMLVAATPALAQKTVEGRVDKLEKEMQAVQRKVFPGGAGQIVAPDVTPEAAPVQQAGSPASSPLADLTSRVSAIETQVARLTGQVEESDHRLRLLEDANTKLTAQIQALQTQMAAAAQPAPETPPPAPFVAPSGPPPKAPTSAATKAPAATKPNAASSQARMDAVAAVEKPSSGNGALDGYTYGYRLWMAKFYPEAEAQLEDTLSKYGNDPVASRTGNLLGRAYLDDGKPTQAAKVLFDNYRDRPKGDRASESLAWVGEALIQLKRPKDACLAYDELKDNFGDGVPANVKDMVAKGRVTAKCGA